MRDSVENRSRSNFNSIFNASCAVPNRSRENFPLAREEVVEEVLLEVVSFVSWKIFLYFIHFGWENYMGFLSYFWILT